MSDRQLSSELECHVEALDCHWSDDFAHCWHFSCAYVGVGLLEIAAMKRNVKINGFENFKFECCATLIFPLHERGFVLFRKNLHSRWVVCTLLGNFEQLIQVKINSIYAKSVYNSPVHILKVKVGTKKCY
jgi:hypothetical protein